MRKLIKDYFCIDNSKMLSLISCLASFALFFSFSLFGIVINEIFFIYSLYHMKKRKKIEVNARSISFICSVFGEVMFCCFFLQKWMRSSIILRVASFIRMPIWFFLLVAGSLLSVLSFPAFFIIVERVRNFEYVAKDEKNYAAAAVICFLSALGIVTVCSRCSFLYPFNDWYDSNCFFTVGKSMMNGVVPYRDLFEQKGPLLYLIHGISWLISRDTFIGVYLFEIVSLTVFLYYSYQIMCLYSGRKIIFMIPLLALICCTSGAFFRGDSAEEFSLPFLSASLFIFVKAEKEKKLLSDKEAVLIGILSGCIFWIKFSLIGMYLGWYLVTVVHCIRNKVFGKLGKMTLYIILGVLISTMPHLIYYALNGALRDWLDVYLIENLFMYSNFSGESYGVFFNLYQGLDDFTEENPIILVFIMIGIVYMLLSKNKKEKSHIVSMILFEFIFIYIGGRHYFYYSLILNVFSVFGLAFVFNILNELPLCHRLFEYRSFKMAALICSIVLAYMITPNRSMIGISKDELPQYQFAKIINEDEGATLLNYGFLDGGFYTVANIVPNCRYFCKVNMNLPEMLEVQEDVILNGLCDYVVTRRPIKTEKYELIAESQSVDDGISNVLYYYLYKLK